MILVDTNVLVAAGNTAENEHRQARELLETARGDLLVAPMVMAELVEQYADLELGGTDASLIAIAERLRIDTVATFDRRHFTVVRPRHVDALTLLPL